MEHSDSECHFKCLSRDLLAHIMVRLDGSSLASAACTCSELHGLAQDQRLWKHLCHSTWPSTSLKEAHHLFSSFTMEGFNRFYADSYPLILHDRNSDVIPIQTHLSPSDFASFIDVYYRDKCILSRVLDGMPNTAVCGDGQSNDFLRWFLNCPFRLVLFDVDSVEGDEVRSGNDEYGYTQMLSPRFMAPVQIGKTKDHSKELVEGLRLSWVLFDKKRGRAVNLSSWKPVLVKKIWATDGDYLMHFGCIVPVEENVLPHKLAKCLIMARCSLAGKEGYLRWKEISMHFEDTIGAHINGDKSLIIMNRALYCLRSNKPLVVEKAYEQFEEQKQEIIRKKKLKDTIADWLFLSFEVSIFITFGYYYFFSPI
ncbi:hypothetical protein CCACVL1_13308 [Corchorus capsularis]|uniref:F-box domain-containing protein n=1 Tax=Corchorus capsularis TaxID=210143 RepID=A0A1R3IBF1_COCAP|nr:hypothetical protein CCACVL1_13308 [Corchorus capsularis]